MQKITEKICIQPGGNNIRLAFTATPKNALTILSKIQNILKFSKENANSNIPLMLSQDIEKIKLMINNKLNIEEHQNADLDTLNYSIGAKKHKDNIIINLRLGHPLVKQKFPENEIFRFLDDFSKKNNLTLEKKLLCDFLNENQE